MPTPLEQLTTRRDAILAELAGMSAASAGGTLNHTAMGRSFDHVGYKDGLYRELKEINSLITAAEGPIDFEAQGIP